MLKILRLASNERHWKITGMAEDVKCMQNDYVELKKRVELIKASNDEGGHHGGRRGCRDVDGICKRERPEHYDICEEHSEETDEALDEIETCVDEVQNTLDIVRGFSHPCDGPGWHQVIYLDMNDPNTDCPGNWDESYPDVWFTRRSCIIPFLAALRTESVTFQVNEEYSQVCGRVHGYSTGTQGGFSYFYENNNTNITSPSDTDFFASGLTLYREIDDEHIWSFIAATPCIPPPTPPTISNEWCPCDVGENEFFDTFGDLPSFIGTDYFCDYVIIDGVNEVTDAPLWDGLNCVDESDCCDYGTPPYFQRVLPLSDDNIVAKLSVEIMNSEVGISFMEIYVR